MAWMKVVLWYSPRDSTKTRIVYNSAEIWFEYFRNAIVGRYRYNDRPGKTNWGKSKYYGDLPWSSVQHVIQAMVKIRSWKKLNYVARYAEDTVASRTKARIVKSE
jgi:hypothetical protein